MPEPEVDLVQWNRQLASEVISLLEGARDNADEAISRLRGFLAVNPGGPSVPPVPAEEPAAV